MNKSNPEEMAREVLANLEALTLAHEQSGTISIDTLTGTIAFSDRNLELIAKALREYGNEKVDAALKILDAYQKLVDGHSNGVYICSEKIELLKDVESD